VRIISIINVGLLWIEVVKMSEVYVSYLRVSTTKQSKSGLGLESQQQIIDDYVEQNDGKVIASFTEVESGKRNDRSQLEKAIQTAKKSKAKLIIAKLDRVSRKVSFISNLMDKGVDFVIAEMPNATPFQIHIHSAMAEEEGRLISNRTSLALQKAKQRGVKLGLNGKVLSKENKRKANHFSKSIRKQLIEFVSCGYSYQSMANALNNMGVKSIRGGDFHPQTIKNYCVRLKLV
jgi:DNA invertase Pin-like site-specific DNA recombinase